MKKRLLHIACLTLLFSFSHSFAQTCKSILGQSLKTRKADLLTSPTRHLQMIQYRAPVPVETVHKQMLPIPKPPSKKPTVELVKVEELERTYFALFSDTEVMNQALDRITHFICGAGIISNHKLSYPDPTLVTQGHDIRGSRIPIFLKQYQESPHYVWNPKTAKEKETKQVESDFWNHFIHPMLEKKPTLFLIGASRDSDPYGTLSHELKHAQYEESDEMRWAVQDYWFNVITEKERWQFTKSIANFGYDPSQMELLINEFQAYTIDRVPPEGKMGELANKHREKLRKFLADRNIYPLLP